MANIQHYHSGGYEPAAPALNVSEQWTNATQPTDPTPTGYTAWDEQGNVTAQRALTADEAASLAQQDDAAAATQATAQALTNLQGLLVNLGPALAQGQHDAANYPAMTPADQAAVIVRLIGNTMALAEGVSDLITHLGLTP